MNANVMKTNNGKLIAAAAVLALVVCVFAVAVPSVDADTFDTTDVTIPQNASESVAIIDASDEDAASQFTAALSNSSIKQIVIKNSSASGGTAGEGNPTVLDLTTTPITIGADKEVYIGNEAAKNGFWDTDAEGGATNIADYTTLQVKFGDLTVQGKLYNVLGQNKATSGLWVEKLTLNGNGILFSTCALNGSVSERNGFFTSSANSTGSTPSVFTHLYSATIDAIAPYTNAMNYGGLDLTSEKAIIAYGNTTVAADDAKDSSVGSTLLFVNNNAVMTVQDGADVTFSEINIKSKAQVNLYGNLTGTTGVTNDGKVNVLASDAGLAAGEGVSITGSGSIDTSAIMKDAVLGGDLETSTEFGPNQTVTVTSNLTLQKNTKLTIEGKLIIPEGMTVTIQEGAQLIINGQTATVENDGTISVQATNGLMINGGTFTNNGTISAQYLPTGTVDNNTDDPAVITIAADAKLDNFGTVIIGTDSGITINGTFTNEAESVYTMTGTMAGTIDNAGTVDFNGRASANVFVNLTSADAVANITAVVSGDYAVYVTDDGYKSSTKTPFANEKNDVNYVLIKGKSGFSIGGITVGTTTYTSDANQDGKDETYKGLDISGTVVVSAVTGTANSESAVLRLAGDDLFVSQTLNVGAGVQFAFGYNNSTDKLNVTGTLNITADSSVTGTDGKKAFDFQVNTNVSFVVSGEITSLTNLHGDTKVTMNAAMYTTVANAITTYHYTTLGNAVSAVADATTKVIDVYGTIDVDGQVDISNGMTVRMNTNKPSQINITEDGDITVADGGVLSTSGQKIVVEGSLYAETARTGITGVISTGDVANYSIESEVYSTDGTDALYTTLVDAMAAAESGDTIELYSKGVNLKSTSFVIKDGVTVDTNGQSFTVEGSTLTIDGTLFINDSTYDVKDFTDGYTQKSTIVLNGYIKNTAVMNYTSTQDEFPAGAYYEITENGVPYYHITTVANAAPTIRTTENDTVTINGKVSMGTVSFAGVEDYLSHVIIANGAEVTSGNVTLEYAYLTVENGAQFTGTVANAEGSVDVKMVNSDDDTPAALGTAVFTADYNEDGVNVLTVTGQATGAEMTFSGNVTAGTMTVDKLTVDGTATVIGPMTTVKSELTVNGTVNVTAGQLSVEGDSFVTGTVYAAVPSAESTDAGQADLGNMYVGIDKVEGKNNTFTLVAGTAGDVSGNVTADIAYVSTDSTVPEDMITGDDMLSTEFYVNDELWMTAYTDDSNKKANVPNAPVTDAKFIGWDDADGNLVYYAGATKPDDAASGATTVDQIVVGSHDGKLYANVNYNVYNVTIRTDGGINSVAIDGNILSQTNMNEFSADGLTAGQHTISYTLKNGYQGEATLSADGITVDGMNFTLTGDYSKEIYLNLSGTEPATPSTGGSTSGGDDGLGLTDYLLIILVILIVIMAIIVAMRLMRS